MSKRELTDLMLRALKVAQRTEIKDTRQVGLELHAYPSGKRSFSFRIRGPDGVSQRVKLGSYPHMKLGEAREKAAELARLVKSGAQVTVAAAKKAKAAQLSEQAQFPTLLELLREYEAGPGRTRAVWGRTVSGKESEAFKRIAAVYGDLFDRKVTEITVEQLSHATHNYKPASGKESANGQASKARLYLKPVLDWAARRGMFRKLGTCRSQSLVVPDLYEVADPAADDDTITGERDRVLDQKELAAV